MSKQKAVTTKSGVVPIKKSAGVDKTGLSFSVKHNANKTCEVYFIGSLDKSSLRINRPDINRTASDRVKNAYIDLTGLEQIDDAGIAFLVKLIARLEKGGVKFQVIYSDGQVGSKVDSSGLAGCLANPTHICG